MSKQTTIFDFIEIPTDDIKMKLESLQVGDVFRAGNFEVHRDKFYVVSKGNEFEEWFSNIEDVYKFINYNC